jgi:hypothetical protein
MAALTGQRPPGARPHRQTHGEAHRSQVKHARELYASKEHTVADIVALLGIGWQTIYRAHKPAQMPASRHRMRQGRKPLVAASAGSRSGECARRPHRLAAGQGQCV